MDLLETAALFSSWTRLKRSFELLAAWDSPCGILFESHDGSGAQAAHEVAKLLGGGIVDLAEHGIRKPEWDRLVGRFFDGSTPPVVLKNLGMERICIIAPDLDRCPEWVGLRLKGLLENNRRPVCILASAKDVGKIPGYIHSHFLRCRKIGRPRTGTTGAKGKKTRRSEKA